MSKFTDLEILIRHLAGRLDPTSPGRPPRTDGLDGRLDDPTSPESRFFDEIRRKTRSLLDEPSGETGTGADVATARPAPAADTKRRRRFLGGMIVGAGGVAGAAALGGMLGVWTSRAGDARTSAELTRIVAELRPLVGRLPPAPTRPPGMDPASPAATPDRLAADLASLGDRLESLRRLVEARLPTAVDRGDAAGHARPEAAATLATIATDLTALHRELASSEAATTRQIQEMRTVTHELNSVVRRYLSRPQTTPGPAVSSALLAVAVQALIHNLQSQSAQVRGEAVEQLVRIGAPARSAIPALQQRLPQESDQNVRAAIETAVSVLSSN